MFKFLLLFFLVLSTLASWAQPLLPTTPYTFRFMTNRTAAEARDYLDIEILAGGASNAVVNVNGTTNAQQRFQVTTNSVGGVPTVTTNGHGAIATNFFNLPWAGPSVSGLLHANDFANVIFATEIDTWAEYNAINTDVDLALNTFTTNVFDKILTVSDSLWLTLTNAMGQVQSGQAVLVLGGDYFGTNRFSWYKDGVALFIAPGVNIRHGLSNSAPAGMRDLFSDDGVARTMYVGGYGNFWISNNIYLGYVSNKNSRLIFELNNGYSLDRSGGQPLFQVGQGDGGGVLDLTVRDTISRHGYDTLVVGGGGYLTARGRRLMVGAGGQWLETSGHRFALVDFDIYEGDTNQPISADTPVLFLGGATQVKGRLMNLYSNTWCNVFNLGEGTTQIEADLIRVHGTGKALNVEFALSPVGIKNTRFEDTGSATAAPIDVATDGLSLASVEVVTSAANSISGAGTVDISGAFSRNKPTTGVTLRNGLEVTMDGYPARTLSGFQQGSQALTNFAGSGLATFTFTSPTAGQLVGFHDPDTFTNFTAGAGSGDVTAASTFGTDNRIIRSDGTGKGVQASAVSIDDSGNVTGVASINVSGGAAGVVEMGDTDGSHHYRIAANGTTVTNIHEVMIDAPYTGFYFWTVANGTQAVVSIVGGVGTKNVVLNDSPPITNATLVTGVIIPNGAADVALGTAGGMHLNTTDEQLSFHSAADGEISGEVVLPLIQTKSWTFDPKAVCDGAVDRLFLMWLLDDAPEGIIIDEWKVSFEADPTTEVDLDLKYADAMIGVANAVLVDALDTTAGAASEDTDANINGGSAIPNGKVLYLEFGTAYTEANHQIMFQIWYHVEED